jgi:hypothetical protein
LITSTANAGTNNFLIDALLNSGATERRIIGVTLANTMMVVDNDIYKVNIPSSPSSGSPSIALALNGTAVGVRVTSRYVLPDQSTAKNYTAGVVTYPTTAVDPTTRTVTIPAMSPAQLRDPGDPQISDNSNVGQQFLQIEAMGAPTAKQGTLITSTSSTTVNGVGTLFTGQTTPAVAALVVGTVLYDATGTTVIGTISSITNNTTLVLTANAGVANSAPAAKTGTISSTTTSKSVIGVGTTFTTQLAVGNVMISGGNVVGTVASIQSNTSLTLVANAVTAVAAQVLKSGTITATAGATAVTGVGTAFNTELAVGSILVTGGNTQIGVVASITDATNLTLTAVGATNSAAALPYSASPTSGSAYTAAGTVGVSFTGNSILTTKTLKLVW